MLNAEISKTTQIRHEVCKVSKLLNPLNESKVAAVQGTMIISVYN